MARPLIGLIEPLEQRRLLASTLDTGLGPAGGSGSEVDAGGGDGGSVLLSPAAGSGGGGGGTGSDLNSGDNDGGQGDILEYNTDFLTDQQLLNSDSMTVDEVRAFLTSYNSYFRNPVPDVDGTTFDLSTAVVGAGQTWGINPQVLLATIQKEHRGVNRTSRPTEHQMSFIMGSGEPTTATHQIYDSAKRFSEYHQELTNNGVTRSGWRVGVAKQTLDGAWVTPATKATAGQFTYTPFVGAQWGGDDERWGGVWLFYHWWNEFGFNDRQAPEVLAAGFDVDAAKPTLRITFSEPVDKSLSTSDLLFRNLTTGQEYSGDSFALDWDAANNTASFTFPGIGGGEGGVLPDGNYQALIFGSTVTDSSDNPLASNIREDFHVLAGDLDRDRDVDFFDFLTLRGNYGQSGQLFSDGDVNYDGTVDFFDFLTLRENYGVTLPPPGGGGSLFGDDGDPGDDVLPR